jgi:hypothetical protein
VTAQGAPGAAAKHWFTRRLSAALLLVAFGLAGVGCRHRTEELGAQVDRSLAAAVRALIAAQGSDGSWRSPTYGPFKDGLTLSPLVLKAVAYGPDVEGATEARRRGARFLLARVRADGLIDDGETGLIYPVYTASATIIALARIDQEGTRKARDAWLRELRSRQLTENLGWAPADVAYGSWGYSIVPPRRPAGDDPTAHPPDADLSSTLFAVGALRVAGAKEDDPAIRAALIFIERCQNFAEGSDADREFDDGGFFFSPTDPVRNKAGEAGTDRSGRARYHSYGSATADGLRALMRCGLAADHPRVVAARSWLERHFSASSNPGRFAPIREIERDATYHYYAWSVAHAFRALGVREFSLGHRKVAWAEELARELVQRQHADGTWTNPYTASKEDDPLVATSFAVGALGNCRVVISQRQ